VALGHRRLAVIDIEGGGQPMTAAADGATVAVITYDGEVYNHRELRAELAGRGHRFRTASDTEVVLHAYLEWGEAVGEHLNGSFALAVWDQAREELLLVRDQLGTRPLYYARTPAGLLFGSEPKAILASLEVEPVVDANGLREVLAYVGTPGRAIYKGIVDLRPGSVLRLRREGLTVRQYWRLEAAPHTDDLETTVSSVRELLEDIVQRQLISDVPVCALLSGGLDSSAITALAAHRLAAQGRGALRSFALDFAGYADNFTPDGMRDTADSPFARALAAHVGAEHTEVVLSQADLIDHASRATVARAIDSPPLGGDKFTSLYLMCAAIRPHFTVALSGQGADSVFGGSNWFQAADADTFPWLADIPIWLSAQLAPGGSSLFSDDFLAVLDIQGYQRDCYAAALAEVPHTGGASQTERRQRAVNYLCLTRDLLQDLEGPERMSMANGVEIRVPFCDHRLVQYLFNTPWSFKAFDGREKSLLRAAVSDLLPESIRSRRKSPYPATQDPGYELTLRDELGKLLSDGISPVLDLLDAERTRTLLNRPVPAVSVDITRLLLEAVLGLDTWLSVTGARIDL